MSDVNQPDFWQSAYENDRTVWDLGEPTPVFSRLAQSREFPPDSLMVLGAGRGHDARMFAQHGFTVTAVDFADAPIQTMKELDNPNHPIAIVQNDFFALGAEFNGRFQYVLDYTSFCAIQPERRPEYADLVYRLLKPNGIFITLAFPIGKRSGGPPFVVQPNGVVLLFEGRSFQLIHREMPADSVPSRKGIEELLIFQHLP